MSEMESGVTVRKDLSSLLPFLVVAVLAIALSALHAVFMFRGLSVNPDTAECARAARNLYEGNDPSSKRFPLMIWAMVPFAPFGEAAQLNAARVLSLLALIGCGLIAYRIGQSLRLRLPALFPVAILCYWPLLNTVAQATVDGWHIFFLLCTIDAVLRGKIAWSYGFAALAAASRPESLLLPFVISLMLVARERRIKWPQILVPFCCVIPTLLWLSQTSGAKKGYLDEIAHRGMAGPLVAVEAGSAIVASYGTLPALRDVNEGSKAAVLTLLPAFVLVGWLGIRGSKDLLRCFPGLLWLMGSCTIVWICVHTLFPFELAAHRYGMILFVLTLPCVMFGIQNLAGRSRSIFIALCGVCLLPLLQVSIALTLLSFVALGVVSFFVYRKDLPVGASLAVVMLILGLLVAIPKVVYADLRPVVVQVGKDLDQAGQRRVLTTLTSWAFLPQGEFGVPEARVHLAKDGLEDVQGQTIDAMLLTEQDVNYVRDGHLRASTDLRYTLYSKADQYAPGIKPYDVVKLLMADHHWQVEKTYLYGEHRSPLFLYIFQPSPEPRLHTGTGTVSTKVR